MTPIVRLSLNYCTIRRWGRTADPGLRCVYEGELNDDRPNTRRLARLSPQRLPAEAERLLSDAIRCRQQPRDRTAAARTRFASSCARSVRRRRCTPPQPGGLWRRCEVERSLP